jgi:hypothetical protein
MISRFFIWWLIFWLFALLIYQISDVTPQLKNASQIVKSKSKVLTITPVTITASRRDYPSVTENRGKWFISSLRSTHSSIKEGQGALMVDPKGGGFNGQLYTARHVISDTGYNYFINWSIPLTSLYHLSWDLWSATYSWTINQASKLSYSNGLDHNHVLMWQYRNNNWSRLTWTIISSDNEWIIIDLPVVPGDSGSPVIFSNQTLWIVSQSHSWNQAIVQKIQ